MSAATFKNERRSNFTMLANAMLRNPALSLKAKGLLGVMLSFPDDWAYYMSHIETQSADGRDAHRAALRELEDFGYVVRVQTRDERGRVGAMEYRVSDEGWEKADERSGLSVAGKPVAGESVAGKPATTNTDSTKTDSTKTHSKGTGKAEKENPEAFQLPEWLGEEAWADFLAHRKAIKKPLTPVAATRLIAELSRLRDSGQDAGRVIDQSIVNGWAGVFPVKEQQRQTAQVSRGAEVNNNPFTVPVEVPTEEVDW